MPVQIRRQLKKLADQLWHRSLDDCHGSCLLRRPNVSSIVADAIWFYNGKKYDLDSFIVMPNHVHVLVQFRPGASLKLVSQSWLRYTARQINEAISKKGSLWQPEPFDHIVRSPKQFAYLQDYIADNPKKAKLRDGEFLYWTRSGE